MTAYLVERDSLTVETTLGIRIDDHYQPRIATDEGAVCVPVGIFLDRPDAERDCARREPAARELLNPFSLHRGDFEALTSASPDALRAQLVALGLTPPPAVATFYGDGTDWLKWWAEGSSSWTDAERTAVWDLL